ncbi:threonine aldolase family protein [Paracoccaceae bacterium GXU_MW_L88]
MQGVPAMYFSSDNASPVPPQILDALAAANEGYAPPYGADNLTENVRARIREVFEAPDAAVELVPTGTAANCLALALLCPPTAAVFCATEAHIAVDENTGVGFYTGGAVMKELTSNRGKIDPDAFDRALRRTGSGGVHNIQKGALTLTNVTESGACYSLDEIRTLTDMAKAHHLPVHMDGARFANALQHLGCTPAEMTWKAGVDAVSFGGTKNGLMGVETIVLFDPEKHWELELRRKRAGHLFSKHRYLAAQMDGYLADDLWLKNAAHANDMALKLQEALEGVGAVITNPAEGNMLFASLPRKLHRQALEGGASYYLWPFAQSLMGPDDEPLTARYVASWNTSDQMIADLIALYA